MPAHLRPSVLMPSALRRWLGHKLPDGLTWAGGAALVVTLPLVVGLLIIGATGAGLETGSLFGVEWAPLRNLFGLLPLVAGTLAVTLLATLVAAPVGIGAAIGLSYFASARIKLLGRLALGVLAALPSVVIGLSATTNLVPLLGANLLTGAIAIAAMILPTCGLLALAEIEMVPIQTVEAGTALGVDRGTVVRRVVLVIARPGLIRAIGIAVCRALGEALAVAMVCGNVPKLPTSLTAPVRTLTSTIVLEFEYASGRHAAAINAVALVTVALMVLTAAVSLHLWARSRRELGQ